jgi:hypothetical protein
MQRYQLSFKFYRQSKKLFICIYHGLHGFRGEITEYQWRLSVLGAICGDSGFFLFLTVTDDWIPSGNFVP